MWLRSAVIEAGLNYLFFWVSSRAKCTSICSMPETMQRRNTVVVKQWITAASRALFFIPVTWGWLVDYTDMLSLKRNFKVKIQVCGAENFGEAQNCNKQQIWRKSNASCWQEFCLLGPLLHKHRHFLTLFVDLTCPSHLPKVYCFLKVPWARKTNTQWGKKFEKYLLIFPCGKSQCSFLWAAFI